MVVRLLLFAVLSLALAGGALLKVKDPLRRRSSPNHIDPSRLLVATVLDLDSFEIIRDVHTLLRSVRVFGASLNKATIVVCVPVASSGATVIPNGAENLYALLEAYGVELAFIPQVESGRSKTQLKFAAFREFSAARGFDYLLWLDADSFILRDPVPLLFIHPLSGMVQCAPELYSYMVRYPEVNETRVVKNRKLAPFRLAGRGEMAPHGTCNTGVLFFDRTSLAAFLAALPAAEAEVEAAGLALWPGDRFMDSLLFVAAINRAAIHVEPFPQGYQLNYMAFFEQEMMQGDLPYTQIPAIAQFVSDTELFCFVETVAGTDSPPSGSPSFSEQQAQASGPTVGQNETSCICKYVNQRAPKLGGSLLQNSLEHLLSEAKRVGEDYCRMLAGAIPLPQRAAELSPALKQLWEQRRRVQEQESSSLMSVVGESASLASDPGADPGTIAGPDASQDHKAITYPHCALIKPPALGSVLHVPLARSMVPLDMELCCAGPSSLWEQNRQLAIAVNITVQYSEARAAGVPGAVDNEQGPWLLQGSALVQIPAEGMVWMQNASVGEPIVGQQEQHSSWCFSWLSSVSREGVEAGAAGDSLRGANRFLVSLSPALLIGAASSALSGDSGGQNLGSEPQVDMTLHMPRPLPVTVIVDELTSTGLTGPVAASAASPPNHQTHNPAAAAASDVGEGRAQQPLERVPRFDEGWAHTLASQPLRNRMPLASQLQLGSFLGAQGIEIGASGVAVCCDTHLGVEVVRSMLANWMGRQVTVLLLRTPASPAVPSSEGEGEPNRGWSETAADAAGSENTIQKPAPASALQALAVDLGRSCASASRQSRCVIVAQPSDAKAFAWALSSPPGALGWVYLDVFESLADYGASLEAWFHALAPGGVLMGSRFEAPSLTARPRHHSQHRPPPPLDQQRQRGQASERHLQSRSPYLPQLEARDGVRLAVDEFSDLLQLAPLATYMDAAGGCGSSPGQPHADECLAAFYFVKDFRSSWA